MADNWTSARTQYQGKPIEWYYDGQDNQELKMASVHEHRNEALFVERMADKFTFCIVEKRNPIRVLYEPRVNGDTVTYDEFDSATDAADKWMENHPDGLEHIADRLLRNP